jgi:hypothetical protein
VHAQNQFNGTGVAPLAQRPPSRDKVQIARFFRLDKVATPKRLAVACGTTVREFMAKAFSLLFDADRGTTSMRTRLTA